MPFAKVEPLELLVWIAGIGTLACLIPGIVLFVWGALMEGGILRHVRGMRVGGPQPQAAGGGDDGFTAQSRRSSRRRGRFCSRSASRDPDRDSG